MRFSQHPFSVVRSAGADASYNYVNPVRRDVVSLGAAGSNVTIRFTTNNAGPWIMHWYDMSVIFLAGLILTVFS